MGLLEIYNIYEHYTQRYETASPCIYEHRREYAAAEKYSHQLSTAPLPFESKFKSLDE